MKGYKLYLVLATLLLAGYLLAQYNRPKAINWDKTLRMADKIPYGTYVLHSQLAVIYPGAMLTNTNKSPYELFGDSALTPGNYLMVAKSVSIGKNDFEQMLTYIKAGNSIFISTMYLDGFIADTLKLSLRSEYDKLNPRLSFTSPQLRTREFFEFDNNISNDYFFKFNRANATVLAKNEFGHATYIRYNYGRGALYLFANPLTLSNYGILSTPGSDYGAIALSYLPKAKNVYWDQYQNHDIGTNQSALRVLFEFPALQWAYYLSIISLLLFVVYEIKRRQRIIPVIEALKNSSLEFVTVVGNVYYEQRNNSNIATKKTLYFLEHLRQDHRLITTVLDKDFTQSFANKTGIDYALAEKLVTAINYVTSHTVVTDRELIQLNQLIENYYTQTGSYGK